MAETQEALVGRRMGSGLAEGTALGDWALGHW